MRDECLGKSPNDIDLVVEGARDLDEVAEDLKRSARERLYLYEFPAIAALRCRYPGLGTGGVDVAMCRSESLYKDHRHPSFVAPADLYTDLGRRDFTINAMAKDLMTGRIVD